MFDLLFGRGGGIDTESVGENVEKVYYKSTIFTFYLMMHECCTPERRSAFVFH